MRPSVLVVHDGPAVRQMFINMLSPLGYRVLAVPDGASAVNMIQAEPIEIIFIETRINSADTMGLLDQLRSASGRAKIIVIGDNEDDEVIYHSLKSGVFACLIKPFSLDSVMDITESAHLAVLRERAASKRAA